MPAATFKHTTTVDATPSAVWDRLQDPDVWSAIGPVQRVWDPVVVDGVLQGFTWSTDLGGVTYEGTCSVLQAERPGRYELALDTTEIKGTISVGLSAANPHGTNVDVAVEVESKGLLSSMFFPVVSRAIGDGLPDQVDALAGSLAD